MRYSLVTLFIVLCVGAVLSLVAARYFRAETNPDIKYLEMQGFAVTSFPDANGWAYMTSIRANNRVIQDFDVNVIGKQTKIGLLQMSRCQFETKQLIEMIQQPELSHLQLDGVPLSTGMLTAISAKTSLLGLDISCWNLSAADFQTLCQMPNLGLLRLSDVTPAQRTILQQLAIQFPRVKIFCNSDNLPLPDSGSARSFDTAK